MSHGSQLAQVAHAAADAGAGHQLSTHVVVLQATKDELYALLDTVPEPFFVEEEPDPPFNGEMTAIAFPVQKRERIRPLLRHLKLAGG